VLPRSGARPRRLPRAHARGVAASRLTRALSCRRRPSQPAPAPSPMPEIEEISTEKKEKKKGVGFGYEKEKIDWTVEKLCEKLKTSIEEVSTAKTIDWGWKDLVGEHAACLGELLSHAACCVNCNLFVNEMGPEGGKAIGRALPHMPKLVQIDLQQWQIEPEGAKYVADALAAHPRIKSLKMHYCKLGWEGTEYIAKACAYHKTLTNLDLGDNGMDEEGARHIAAMLTTNTSITRLDLSKNEGLVDNPEVKEWFLAQVTKILAERETPLTLILENSPGKKWHPNDRPPPPVREDWRG
jgi:Ran GTPase-activating protein (RanGAP) involved in mRNA processing and transport